jgi:hypothetical protein
MVTVNEHSPITPCSLEQATQGKEKRTMGLHKQCIGVEGYLLSRFST